MRQYFALFILLSVLLPFIVFADSASSTNFLIESGVIDIGGNQATSTNFSGRSSLGQVGTGISSSTSFILKGGFLYFPSLVAPAATGAPPTPPPTPTPQPTGGGGTGFLYPPKIIPPEIIAKCDFNGDGRCNIIDLSIILYYYGMSGTAVRRYDLNGNNAVDFPDLSVMMFYWTG